jgi:hypothetical protein
VDLKWTPLSSPAGDYGPLSGLEVDTAGVSALRPGGQYPRIGPKSLNGEARVAVAKR